jgi:hypothetical protein
MERLKKLLSEQITSRFVNAFTSNTLVKKHTIALGREDGIGNLKQVLRIDLGNAPVRYMDRKTLQEFIKVLQQFEKVI